MSTDPRHLHWDACLNVRDLGGFPTRDGRTTRSHAVIRADNLCRLTAHGRAALMRYGVRTAINSRYVSPMLFNVDAVRALFPSSRRSASARLKYEKA